MKGEIWHKCEVPYRLWINYMGGVAMIIAPDGSIRYIPVKGLESGTMR